MSYVGSPDDRPVVTPAADGELVFQDVATGAEHRFRPNRLVVAGFTGRDAASVRHHIEELREFGAVVPDTVPVFMALDPGLVTTAPQINVSQSFTSGEIEAAVVVSGNTWLLVASSDHTDRELERIDLLQSKQACPKILSEACIDISTVASIDAVELTSWVDGEDEPYQSGTLADLLPLPEIVRLLRAEGTELSHGDVVLLGTVPVLAGGLRPATRFRGRLHIPELDQRLEIDYRIDLVP